MHRDLWTRRPTCHGAVWMLLLVAAGCRGNTASVSGKVIYQGEPVTSGSVTFYGADGRLDSGWIRPDGSYTVAQAPVGPVKVTVVSSQPRASPTQPTRTAAGGLSKGKTKGPEHAKPPDGAEPLKDYKPPAGTFVVVPEKFKDPDRSGLAFTLSPGPQRIDLDLRP